MKNVLSIIVAVVMFAALASAVDPPACAPGWEVGACGCTLNVAGNYTINASGLTSDGSDCITISANDVTLDCQQHTITGNGTSGNGIDLQYLDGVTVENCSITDFYNGIYLYSFFDFYHDTLIGNTITSSHNTGIYVHGTGNNITGNTLTDNNCPAIYVDNADNNSITGNTLSSNSEGIELVASEGNVITGNTAGPDNGDGISLIDSAGNNFTGNTATGNDGYDFYCNSQDTNIDGGSNACDNRDSCRWVQSCGFSTFVVNKTSPACTAANGGGYFGTITGAISAANGSRGDRIIVCNGTYDESIGIDKEVNIIGESRAGVITGTFYIHDSSYASVSNLTISPDYRVLDVERADHVAVSNITVDGDVSFAHFVYGIYIDTTSNTTVSGILMNNIHSLGGNNAYAIYLTNASDNHFSGISGGNITTDNTIGPYSIYGVYLNSLSNGNTFDDITFGNVATAATSVDATGIVLSGANYNNFTAIQFNNITGTSAIGMVFDGSDNNAIQSLSLGNLAASDGEAKFIYLHTSAEYNNLTGITCGDINASEYAYGIRMLDKSHNTFSQITAGNINGTVGAYGMSIIDSLDDKFFNVSVGNVSGGSSSAYGAYLVRMGSDVLSNFHADSVSAGGSVAAGIYGSSSNGDNLIAGGSIGTITANAASQHAYGIGWNAGNSDSHDNITGMTLGHIVAPGGSGSAYGLAYWNTGNSYFTGLTFDNVTGSPPNGYAYGVYSGYGNSGNIVRSLSFGKISGTGVQTSAAVYLSAAEADAISDVNVTELQSTTSTVYGVIFTYTTLSNVSNVRIGVQDANTTTAGAFFDHSNNNLVSDLTIGDITSHNDVAFGVQFESSNLSTVDGITTGNITSETTVNAYGAYFEDSYGNTVANANFENIVAGDASVGVNEVTDSYDNIFANSTLPTLLYEDAYVQHDSNLTMLNTTFNETNVELDGNGLLNVSWYYNVYVNQTEGGGLIRGAAPDFSAASTFSWANALEGRSPASSRAQNLSQRFESKLQHNGGQLGLQPEAGNQAALQAGNWSEQESYYVQLFESRLDSMLQRGGRLFTGEPVPDAWIVVNDSFNNTSINNTVFDGQTGLDGYIGWRAATEYVQNSTNTTIYTPHIATATKDSDTASVEFTLNHSTLINFSFSLSPLKVVNNSGPACETGDYYSTIASALAAAPEGGMVVVCNGTYNEGIHVNKSVNLFGEDTDGVVIAASGPGPVVSVDPGLSINMTDFTLQNGTSGINASGTHDSVFMNLIIGNIGNDAPAYGIDASYGERNGFAGIAMGNITSDSGEAYGLITDETNGSIFFFIFFDGNITGASDAVMLSANGVNGTLYGFIILENSLTDSAGRVNQPSPFEGGSVVSTGGDAYLVGSRGSQNSIFLIVGAYGEVNASGDAVAFFDEESTNNTYANLGVPGGVYSDDGVAITFFAGGSDQLHLIGNTAIDGEKYSPYLSVGLYLPSVTNSEFNGTYVGDIYSDGTSMGVMISGTNNTINGFRADDIGSSDQAVGFAGGGILREGLGSSGAPIRWLDSSRIIGFSTGDIFTGGETDGMYLIGGTDNHFYNFSTGELYSDDFIGAGIVLFLSDDNTIVNFSAYGIDSNFESDGVVIESGSNNSVQGANFGTGSYRTFQGLPIGGLIESQEYADGVAIWGGANNTISGFAATGISAGNGTAYGAYFEGGRPPTLMGVNDISNAGAAGAGSRPKPVFGWSTPALAGEFSATSGEVESRRLYDCWGNIVANSTIPEANYSAFLLSCNATMLNTTFDESSAVELNGTLNVSWYYNVHVTSGGVPADGAILGVTDTFHRTVFSGTLPSGSTGQQVGTEYTENSTFAPPPPGAAGLLLPPAGDRTYYSPYEASATLGSASGSVSFALDSSKDIILEVAGGPYVPEENGGSSYGWTPTPTPYNPTPVPTNTPEVSPIPSGTPQITPTPAANATETPTPSITPTPPPVITPTPVPTHTPAWITPEPTPTPPAPCMGFALLLFGAAGVMLALRRK